MNFIVFLCSFMPFNRYERQILKSNNIVILIVQRLRFIQTLLHVERPLYQQWFAR